MGIRQFLRRKPKQLSRADLAPRLGTPLAPPEQEQFRVTALIANVELRCVVAAEHVVYWHVSRLSVLTNAAESTLQCAAVTRHLAADRNSADRIVNFLQECSCIRQAVLFALDDRLCQNISD